MSANTTCPMHLWRSAPEREFAPREHESLHRQERVQRHPGSFPLAVPSAPAASQGETVRSLFHDDHAQRSNLFAASAAAKGKAPVPLFLYRPRGPQALARPPGETRVLLPERLSRRSFPAAILWVGVTMSIGGVDIVLLAPAGQGIGDLFVRACRRHWSGNECFFQRAGERAVHSLRDPWVWRVGTASKEFFVYKDRAAASSWATEGLTRDNANTMFHFIIGEPGPEDPKTVEVAFVCDRLTPEVKGFLTDLKTALLAGFPSWERPEAA
jgi:hypothetical protein